MPHLVGMRVDVIARKEDEYRYARMLLALFVRCVGMRADLIARKER